MKRALSVVVLAAAGVGVLGVAQAGALPVTTGSLAFSGDPGDWISGGDSYSYSTANNDTLTVYGSEDNGGLDVSVRGKNSDNWDLHLQAPSGQALKAGTYDGATRWPFQAPTAPGLDLSGNGRGCNTSKGTFTIQDVVFGPHGYVQTLDATYEQHCEGGTTAARGEVHIANPAPPAELGTQVVVSTNGTASTLNGNAYISGTVTCNENNVAVGLSGTVTQVAHNIIIRANYSATVTCKAGQAVPWTATAVPTGTTPFTKGKVEVLTHSSATDPVYNVDVTTDTTSVVTLKKV
jgi:hypothetical protein